MYEIRSVDLKEVPGNDFIKFLKIEMPERKGHGPVRFARVRYALNGGHTMEENGLPIDLGKGIFIATLEDEELCGISRNELEKVLQEAAVEIVKIAWKEWDPPNILKSILKGYSYLQYDEHLSKPPDVLKCCVTDPNSSRHAEDIFEIARRLNVTTGEDYKVFYGGNSSEDDNFDEVWTWFSLRKLNFQKGSSNEK